MRENEEGFVEGLVSVVTPVYNNEAFLPEMLDSILAQTYDKIQMILVDDGSEDSTVETALSYEPKFKARGYDYSVICAEHKNASAAVCTGLGYVRGEYLIWPDSDDILLSTSVEKRVSFLYENPEYDSVRSLPEYFDTVTGLEAPARETLGTSRETGLFWEILEGRSYVSCGCYMLRSSLFFEIYPERKIPIYDVGQNFQMLLPYMYRHSCATLPEALYRVRVHGGSHSVRKKNLIEEISVLKKFESLIDDVTMLCDIEDKEELLRIESWKQRRRKNLRRKTFNNLLIVRLLRKLKHIFLR